MKIVDKYAPKITRDGDVFTYMGPIDKDAKKIDMSTVFHAAAATQDAQVKIVAALGFLEDCFTLFAATGEGCNEYQTVGLRAICKALVDLAEYATDGREEEHRIINAIAAGEV